MIGTATLCYTIKNGPTNPELNPATKPNNSIRKVNIPDNSKLQCSTYLLSYCGS